MSKTLQINIDEPCHENWQQMTPNEQGRFCGSCQKTVVDFTAMTDKEILDYISQASHNICGRVNDDQMNRDIKAAEHKKRFSFAYIWNLILATVMVTKVNAQVTPAKNKPTTVVVEQDLVGLIAMKVSDLEPVLAKGIVLSAADGTPVNGASIIIKDKKTGTASDSAGNFSLPIKQHKPVELLISCIGYETQTLPIEKLTNLQQLKIALKPEVSKLDTVAVTGYPKQGNITMVAGGIWQTVKVSKVEKVKRTFSDWMPKKDIKVFPNPTTRGEAVNVSLALKQAGKYRMELLDASGKIIHAQLIQMQENTRVVQVPTNSTWSAGVYWLRISGQHIKNVYQSKVIIQ